MLGDACKKAFQAFVCSARNNNKTAAWAQMEQRVNHQALLYATAVPSIAIVVTFPAEVIGIAQEYGLSVILSQARLAAAAEVAEVIPLLSVYCEFPVRMHDCG